VTAPAGAELEKAVDWIKNIVRVVAAGEIFEGVPVTRVEDYGIFVEVLPKQDGMVHVSEMSWQRVESPHDLFKIGDHVKVVVKEIDDQGRISLSMKRLTPPPADFQERAPRERDDRAGGGDRGGRPQGRGGFNGGGGRGGDRGGRRF
jgi:polyribonucleotide nucleotidyltransferase